MAQNYRSYVAIGDSFTEGMGDETPAGDVRGWADLVALGLALANPEPQAHPFTYANLAIRGRLLAPLLREQLDPAISLGADLLSINGGGNDIMRAKVSIESVTDDLVYAVQKAARSGCRVLLVSGANPTRHIPFGRHIEARGNQFAQALRERLPLENTIYVDNWADEELAELKYWSRDKLHLGPLGHERVAAKVLAALEVELAKGWNGSAIGVDHSQPTAAYWREYVLPWIGRRLTGRSSGDNRVPKSATLQPVPLPTNQ